MSAKTKIVVFHLKELIYTGLFIALGILFIILMVLMFSPSHSKKKHRSTEEQALYTPGVYTTQITLGNATVDIEMITDRDRIHSLRIVNIEEDIATMYPLIRPTFDEIASRVIENQSTKGISYSRDTQYTTKLLLDAIEKNILKATCQLDR